MRRLARALSATLLLSLAAPAFAQDAAEDGYNRSELSEQGFVAVDDSIAHVDTGLPYVYAAYGVFWLLILGYVVRLGRLHARVSNELGTMRRELVDIGDRLDELEEE